MGSLSNGGHNSQANNVFSLYSKGNELRKLNTESESESVISNEGVIDSGNYRYPLGVHHHPDGNVQMSGIPLVRRDLRIQFTGVAYPNYNSYVGQSGDIEHVVTRSVGGLHTSISRRELPVNGTPRTITERKVFFLESDRADPSNPADWTIFKDSWPTGTALGDSDTDFIPEN